MSEKPNNPQDHAHGDYHGAWFPALIALYVAVFAFVLTVCNTPDVDTINQRIDELECRIADDETACLRDVLEETR